MFIEAGDLLGCQSPAKSEDEVVVRQLSFNLTMRNRHFSLKRIDMSNFSFDEVHSSIEQGVPQVESNVLRFSLAESESYQCRVKNKLAVARHERDLVFVTELFGQTLCGYHAAKSASQDQNVR